MRLPWQFLKGRPTGILAVIVTASLAPAAHAQSPKPGIYLEVAGKTGDEALEKLEANIMQTEQKGALKMGLTGGLAKGELVGKIEGGAADLRVAGTPSFQFIFDPNGQKPMKAPTTMEDAMSMGMGFDPSGMPPYAKSPKDFGLIRLEARDDNRQASMGKVGGVMGGRGKPENLVPLIVEEVGPKVYRVKPKDPLPPGEYAFYLTEQSGGQAWDFGVDKK